jgi:hypothetical protein
LRAHLDTIAAAVGEHPHGIVTRPADIEAATLRAQLAGARILIW